MPRERHGASAVSGDWETYYLMVGSSSAALIGLLFVVVTLAGEVDPARADAAQSTFLTPTVLHFAIVFVISAAAVAPEPAPLFMASATLIPALVGLFYAVGAIVRLAVGPRAAPHWTDYIFYGVLPAACYLWLIAAAWGVWQQPAFGDPALALGVLVLLLLAIRDAWDLATWLIYHKQG